MWDPSLGLPSEPDHKTHRVIVIPRSTPLVTSEKYPPFDQTLSTPATVLNDLQIYLLKITETVCHRPQKEFPKQGFKDVLSTNSIVGIFVYPPEVITWKRTIFG